jgi:hypothetical protein
MSARRWLATGLVTVLRWAMPGHVDPLIAAAATQAQTLQLPPKRKKRRTSQQATTTTRWLQADVERAQHRAGTGDFSLAARLYRALVRDGMIRGLLNTLARGLVRLPKQFKGDPDAVAYLQGVEGKKSGFERHFPAGELAKFAKDGECMGFALAELLDTPIGPVFCRIDPEFVKYRWWEDRWYYQSINGEELVAPGDGRWCLFVSSRVEPWSEASVWSLGRAFVSKEHAFFYRENWNAKLAHPARAAVSPSGATEVQRRGFLQKLIEWGVNTSFDLPPGWDVKIIEANGRGYESFKETIADANQEIMIAIAGQVVTVTGGTGFANAGIHETIRQDNIDALGKGIAETISEQALPFVLEGKVANTNASFAWDTRKPLNRKEEAEALTAAAAAITALVTAMRAAGLEVDVLELAQRFSVPLAKVQEAIAAAAPVTTAAPPANDTAPADLAPTDAFEADEPLQDDAAAKLAARMTEVGADACWHGRTNRCPLCRVEVDADCAIDPATKQIVWSKRWRPIGQARAA